MKFPTQHRPGLPLLVVLALAHCTLLACAVTSGRDDVPPEIAERVNPVELEDSDANPDNTIPPHSVLTEDLIDEPGEATREALDLVLEHFRSRLLESS